MRGFKTKSQVTSYKLQVTSYKKGDQGRLFLFVLRLETCNLRLFLRRSSFLSGIRNAF